MPNATYARKRSRNFPRRRYSKYVTKNYLKAVVGEPEKKWFDVNGISTAVTNTGNLAQLNGIPPGTTSSNRVGNEVSNQSLFMRIDIARGAVDSLLRFVILWWYDGNAAAVPTITDILQTASYNSPLNKVNGMSFKVKYDCTYTLAAGQTQLQVDEIYRKLKAKSEYAPTLNTNTANTLYLLTISNQATVANQPTLTYYSRLNFMDL